jgi:PAS domain S-box-containing protein
MAQKNNEFLSYAGDDLFRSVFDSASIGMVLIAPDGRWVAANEAVCRITGYRREELLKKTIQTITPPEDIEPDLTLMRRLLAGELDHYQINKRLIHKNKQILWVLKSVSLVRDRAGKPQFVIVQIQDISEKTRLAQEFVESRRELENVLTNLNCAVAQYDREKRILYGNSTLAQILGVPLAELVGKTVRELSKIVFKAEKLERVISEIFETKQSRYFESARKIDGAPGFLLTHLTPQLDETGEVETVIALAFNVTQLKKTELELSAALAEIKQLQTILPICSYCKKIRDDHDYWQTVENYISSQTDTKFRASVCPNCYETKVKPDLEKRPKPRRK